ncbi:MAG: hypothetical protein HY721_16765 [Planctomycetes bacterium]|nr:hypothetical protein [Planctomycetota bacterium]
MLPDLDLTDSRVLAQALLHLGPLAAVPLGLRLAAPPGSAGESRACCARAP